MAIKLTYNDLRNDPFQSGLMKIHGLGFKNQFVGYNVLKIYRKVKSELETSQELWIKMLKQFAELNKDGTFVAPEGNPNGFKVPVEKKDAFVTAVNEFAKIEIEIPCHQVGLEHLEGANLTPGELDALTKVIKVTEVDTTADEATAVINETSEAEAKAVHAN